MTALLASHLWQSTLVVGGAALLTLLLRANHARTRYVIWLVASLKFLVPFGALIAIGRLFAWRTADPLPGPALAAIETLTAPFSAPDLGSMAAMVSTVAPPAPTLGYVALLLGIWFSGTAILLGVWAVRWRRVSRLRAAAASVTAGRELDILRSVERRSGARPMTLLTTDATLEPGVVGCLQPVILWPSDISQRMSDQQIEAILLHELAHVKRRDNLFALVHMAIEAIFWFHPLVWWVGVRLVDERERACDEEVVRLGADPHQYAEGILRTCEYAVESPLACVAGVTGANLKRRIVAIVSSRPALRLGASKVALLTVSGLLIAVGPLAAGALSQNSRDGFESVAQTMPARFVGMFEPADSAAGARHPESSDLQAMPLAPILAAANRSAVMPVAAPVPPQVTATSPGPALSFEVASIKLIRDTGTGAAAAVAIAGPGGTVNRFNYAGPIDTLVERAYGIRGVQLTGAPAWLSSDDANYRIVATIPDGTEGTPENISAMLRSLLADRFKLVVREESRELPIYELVVARGDKVLGPNLTPVAPECLLPDNTCERRMGGRGGGGEFGLEGRNQTIERLSNGPFGLEGRVGRPVINRTGLTGSYNFNMKYADERVSLTPSELPTLFKALEEQLGLKLESKRGPVNVVIIDSIQRPTEN